MRIYVGQLRVRSKDMMAALDRNEEVTLVYRHRECGRVVPVPRRTQHRHVTWHPFFGMFPRYAPRDIGPIPDPIPGPGAGPIAGTAGGATGERDGGPRAGGSFFTETSLGATIHTDAIDRADRLCR